MKTLTAQQQTKLETQTITSHNTQANATRENNTIDKIVQHRQDCSATAGTQRTRMAKKRVVRDMALGPVLLAPPGRQAGMRGGEESKDQRRDMESAPAEGDAHLG